MSQQPKAPSFDIPDLELEAPTSKRSAPVSAARRVAPAAMDDFELIPTGAALELVEGIQPDAVPRAIDTTPWPTGRSRHVEQLPIDPAEVTLIAGYGAAPTSALSTPLYASRVYSRRAPLKRAIAVQLQELLQAEAERDTALVQLAHDLRPVLARNELFRRLLEPIEEVERLASERSSALLQADQGLRQEMAKFDEQLEVLREAAAQADAAIVERRASSDAAEQVLRRSEAKQQRILIEIRGVIDVARQAVGPAGGDIPAPQAARLAELQSRAKELEPELAAAGAGHASACLALQQAESERQRVVAAIEQLQRQKASAAGALEQQVSARAANVTDAEKLRRDALCEVARAVLIARGSVAVSQATLERLRQHDRQVENAAIRLETQVRALGSYDTERVRQGVIVVLSALGVVVLAILLKAVL